MTEFRLLSYQRKTYFLLLFSGFPSASSRSQTATARNHGLQDTPRDFLRGFSFKGVVAQRVARLHVTSTTSAPGAEGLTTTIPKSPICAELPVCVAASCTYILFIYQIISPSFLPLPSSFLSSLVGDLGARAAPAMESMSSSMLTPGLDDLGTIDFFQHPDA